MNDKELKDSLNALLFPNEYCEEMRLPPDMATGGG